ncbi:hypothetical protein GQ42DRAFT_158164 [Ramicandelaber brevisporus]|nr:hypothetical protein GQ42DRAFT_158164 [Ramicandelaber brevisporus]
MSQSANGLIYREDGQVTGEFRNEYGRILAQINLPSLNDVKVYAPDACIEFDSYGDLLGEYKIGDDSVLGPDELRLSLLNEFGAKVKIIAEVIKPLPSGLSKDGGTVVFPLPPH